MRNPFSWLNPPAQWQQYNGQLSVITGDQTDFWRKTEYGFIRDSGHFAYTTIEGDFCVEVTFSGRYETLFDQAGLMIRLDADRWVKTGIEFVDDIMNFSTVVTDDTSDWSLIPLAEPWNNAELRARLVRRSSTVSTSYRRSDGRWQSARVAGFPSDPKCQVGVMCCSPQRAGFEVQFTDFTLTAQTDGVGT